MQRNRLLCVHNATVQDRSSQSSTRPRRLRPSEHEPSTVVCRGHLRVGREWQRGQHRRTAAICRQSEHFPPSHQMRVDGSSGDRHPVLLRHALSCVGTRHEREHQRLDPLVPPQGPEHETLDATRLQSYSDATQHPAAQTARQSHSGGMLRTLTFSVALQS